jgi:putative acetyltransferase
MNTPIIPATGKDYAEITEVWEASVRASHHFLTEKNILFFKPLIPDFLSAVNLFFTRDDHNKIAGFLGTADNKIEMLFIHPSQMGKGIGKQFLLYAIHQLKATKVDVNEQNAQAVGFYLHAGFEIESRDELDGLGKPFPILHLKLK